MLQVVPRFTSIVVCLASLLSLGLASTTQGAAHPGTELTALGANFAASVRAAVDERPSFEYRVGMAEPQRHEFALSLRFPVLPGDAVTLDLPKWNPGAYDLTNAHRNVRAVVAHPLDQKGEPRLDQTLPVHKLDENSWQVAHGGVGFALDYRVYCGSYRGIDDCYLDDAMGFFNGAYLFMVPEGHKHVPIDLRIDAAPGGKDAQVVTGLPPHPKAKGRERGRRFWAESFDALIDSPVHAGPVEIIEVDLHGRPLRLAMAGDGRWDPAVLRDEVGKLTAAAAAVFGPPQTAIPFADYTFIVHVRPGNRGGLEHRNSTAIGADPWDFVEDAGKRKFWSVVAHEFFHLWNVKRIRPAVLGPFDYNQEVHTTMLWFSEGFTSYYATLITSRAGLIDEAQVRKDIARRIAAVEDGAGPTLLSVEQSSWETWAKPDDPDNAYFSYYDKGMAIGMILDLHLRAVSKGRFSTDTVFQDLWQRWRDTGLGLTPGQLEQAFVDRAGDGADEVRAIFRDYVRGTAPVDYDRYLAHVGYRLDRRVEEPGPWIGAAVEWDGRHMVAVNVEHGGAGDRGGLGNGDAIVAIDGHTIDRGSYPRQLQALEIGQAHRFTVTRDGRTLDLEISPVEGGKESFEIVELEDVSIEQSRLRREWLGLP